MVRRREDLAVERGQLGDIWEIQWRYCADLALERGQLGGQRAGRVGLEEAGLEAGCVEHRLERGLGLELG